MPWIEFDQNYDFNLQSFRAVDPMIKIKRGDQILNPRIKFWEQFISEVFVPIIERKAVKRRLLTSILAKLLTISVLSGRKNLSNGLSITDSSIRNR